MADSVAPTAGIISDGGQDFLTISYQVRPVGTGYTIGMEASPTLTDWETNTSPVQIADTPNPNGTRRITLRSSVPVPAANRYFVRLRMTLTP